MQLLEIGMELYTASYLMEEKISDFFDICVNFPGKGQQCFKIIFGSVSGFCIVFSHFLFPKRSNQ